MVLTLFETGVAGGKQRFATVSEDGLLTVWDAASGSLLQQHARPTHLAVQWTCIAWHTDEGGTGTIALGSDSGVIAVWDLALGAIVHVLDAKIFLLSSALFTTSIASRVAARRRVKRRVGKLGTSRFMSSIRILNFQGILYITPNSGMF